ncbi:uncharacterized protein PGRI_095150 [Penicillium griseofulvum]|uniref:Uncharacterized protein n=1 Tax=Penicillium patulum TaxID=5078 RepID=A0A135LRB7_PENPA|nr:uncharacterized protein PGRI_095150 [Penicillium griseofulvum]KXG51503.1 hypothetical protein PGRI_095150 [Penicillium griseofulvum]
MADQYAHLLARKQFDWWDDVENDIPLTKTSVHTPIVPSKATNPDEYAFLLVREQFDWCEDVENDIAMKDKSIAMDTNVPIVDAQNLAASSAGYTTTIEPDGEYPQFPVDYYFQENTEDDVAVTFSTNEDTCLDLPHHEFFDSADTRTNGPVTAVELGDSHTHIPYPNEFDLVDDDVNDIYMDVEDLKIDYERHITSDDPGTASELEHETAQPIYPETLYFAEDTEMTDYLNHKPDTSINMKSAHDISDLTQSVEGSQDRHIQAPAFLPESDQDSETDNPPFSEEFVSECEYRLIGGIHDDIVNHWDWLGYPVYNRSMSPPVLSVAFMQAIPKVPKDRDQLGVRSIMRRASQYIDPVLVELEAGEFEWIQWQGELVATSQDPAGLPRKLTCKPTPSKLKIKTMESKDLCAENRPDARYSSVPLGIVSKTTITDWLASNQTAHTAISLSVGIMGTVIKKAWPGPKVVPMTTSSSRASITHYLVKSAWATTSTLYRFFAFSLEKMKAVTRKVTIL